MANVKIKLPDDFLLQLSQLGDRTDEIVGKVLEAGADVVYKRAKTNLRAIIGSKTKYPSEATGELADALGVSPPKLDKSGNVNVKIGFDEPHSGNKQNAMLGNILEYGKHGQPPKPFLKPAVAATKSAALEAMRRTFEDEVKKI